MASNEPCRKLRNNEQVINNRVQRVDRGLVSVILLDRSEFDRLLTKTVQPVATGDKIFAGKYLKQNFNRCSLTIVYVGNAITPFAYSQDEAKL